VKELVQRWMFSPELLDVANNTDEIAHSVKAAVKELFNF
jgi:hypothetical protein